VGQGRGSTWADTGKDYDVNHQDARPAELVAEAAALPDASLGPDAAALPSASEVRGGPEWRKLSFRASGLTIELEITGSGEYRRLLGQLIPRQSAVVDIRHGQGVITVEADTLGRFSADEVPFGQISLRCRLGSDQSPVVTGWITL
jgi:hypothetical protein